MLTLYIGAEHCRINSLTLPRVDRPIHGRPSRRIPSFKVAMCPSLFLLLMAGIRAKNLSVVMLPSSNSIHTNLVHGIPPSSVLFQHSTLAPSSRLEPFHRTRSAFGEWTTPVSSWELLPLYSTSLRCTLIARTCPNLSRTLSVTS